MTLARLELLNSKKLQLVGNASTEMMLEPTSYTRAVVPDSDKLPMSKKVNFLSDRP